VSPTDAEKFLLLLHVPGARSFNDLLTMDGEVCSTFHNACIQRHLLAETIIKTTRPWLKHPISRCLDNCSACLLPSASTVSPLIQYNCGPLIRMPSQRTLPGHNHEVAVNQALHEVDRVFRENGLSCAAIGLPSPEATDDLPSPLGPAPTFDDLTDEQHDLAESVLHSVLAREEEPVSKLHYVDAPGGSGKTYVFNKLTSHLRHQSMKVHGMCSVDRDCNHPHDKRDGQCMASSSCQFQCSTTAPAMSHLLLSTQSCCERLMQLMRFMLSITQDNRPFGRREDTTSGRANFFFGPTLDLDSEHRPFSACATGG